MAVWKKWPVVLSWVGIAMIGVTELLLVESIAFLWAVAVGFGHESTGLTWGLTVLLWLLMCVPPFVMLARVRTHNQ